jgi:protein gp37
MADKSSIEWTDATWNPVTGCSKVSAGCKHCYAEREWARLSANPKAPRYFGRQFTDVQCHMDVLTTPLRWKKPRRIFVNSMSDLFHPDVPTAFIDDVFGVMAGCPQHTFQVLTKRPYRMLGYLGDFHAEMVTREFVKHWPQAETMTWPLPNVWLGVSVEDQASADERIPLLRQTPAAVRWVSAEPLLGPVSFASVPRGGTGAEGNIDWVVAGGESGPHARPMHPDWARGLRDQCEAAGVPFLFKQWGEWRPTTADYVVDDRQNTAVIHRFKDGQRLAKVGKRAAGRLLDGVLHDAYPEVRS